MNPLLALLVSLIVTIQISMPVGTYLLFNGRHDDKTRLWLISVGFMSVGISLSSIRPLIPVFVSYQLCFICIAISMHLMLDVLNRELGKKISWWLGGVFLTSFSVYMTVVYSMGRTETLGIVSAAVMMATYSALIFRALQHVYSRYRSRSVRVLQIGIMLYGLPQFLRIFDYFLSDNPDALNVFQFKLSTNLVILSLVMAILFISLGYWGFTLEKSEHERKVAEAGEDMATQNAERYRQLVQERDRLLVMNSRFSAVSALSSFSAMLIHDIAQPLQTLQLGLERMHARINKGASPVQLGEDLKHLEYASERAGHMVSSLRNLMRSGESQAVPVELKPLIDRTAEILDSETLQKQVLVRLHCDPMLKCSVMCEPTMLQRILINLVSNSLNQFQLSHVVEPEILIRVAAEQRKGLQGALIEVIDNGGGFPQPLIERLGQPWTSKSSDGMGLALMLSKQLLGQWGGEFELGNRSDGYSGAIVRLWLRQIA